MSNSTANHESYPPPFRLIPTQLSPRLVVPERVDSGEAESSDRDSASDPIPAIDLQFLGLTNHELHCCDKLEKACRDWGLFRLFNHGVPSELLNKLEDHAREIFSLSFESKQALFTATPLSYFWGTPALTPSGTALSRGPQNINWVEGLNVPLIQLSQFQPQQHHPTLITSFRFRYLNQALPLHIYALSSISGSQSTLTSPINTCNVLSLFSHVRTRLLLEEYGKHLGRLATAIFEAMTEKLNVDTRDKSKPCLSESTGFIRVYRYPPYSDDNDDGDHTTAWGMDVHTDSSVLSILSQDHVGGLEVLKDGQWFAVKPVSSTLIVNLGDMMQAISNDEYKSVKHRVKVNKHRERVSICYFVFPGEGSLIKSSKYRPFTYSDFQAQVQRDVKALGHKVGLERFNITNPTPEAY